MKSMRNCRKFTFGSLICVLALVICILTETAMVASAAVMPEGSIAVVTADTKLNLRREPQGEIIGKIARGKEVTILSEIDRNGYYRIRVNETGLECYAYGEFLEFVRLGTTNQPQANIPEQDTNRYEEPSNTVTDGEILVVTSNGKLNMRKGPTKKADRIQYLYNGDRLQVISYEVKNDFILVRDLRAGKVGYVHTDYVVLESKLNQEKVCSPENCCPNCICQFNH